MEIESIDPIGNDNFKMLLVDDNVNPLMKLILSKEQLWKIKDYCREHLSYGAQLRKEKQR